MAYGFRVPGQGPLATAESILKVAEAGERLGYGYLAVTDHLVVPREFRSRYPYSETGEWPAGAMGRYMEQLSLLAFLAGRTGTARLLTSIMVLPHRPPVLAAKALATVDVLSGGRLTVGCGVGWLREEFAAIGAPPFEERGRASDEYIRAFRELWTNDRPSFNGRYARFSDVVFEPKPVQKPHPPIWVGGESGPAIRRAARLGDGWMPIGNNPARPLGTPDEYGQAVAELRRYGEESGRDPGAIHLAYMTGWRTQAQPERLADGSRRALTGAAADVAADIALFRAQGVRDFILHFLSPTLEETLEHVAWFAEDVMPIAGR
ncbi:MAG: LLM class F420-dependent oxidoreductase [Alphaproteobacteria bacterium]